MRTGSVALHASCVGSLAIRAAERGRSGDLCALLLANRAGAVARELCIIYLVKLLGNCWYFFDFWIFCIFKGF